MMEFPISGVEVQWWLPLLFAFGIALLSSVGGLSGAFLLLPFQVSFLGFVGPAVSPSNLFYNIVSIPSGAYRYWREGRMAWPLAWAIIFGSLPGMLVGALVRVSYLPDPAHFKPFAGLVLLYIGARLAVDVVRKTSAQPSIRAIGAGGLTNESISWTRIEYQFAGKTHRAGTVSIALLSFLVGIVGGAYGIGGGAIVAPFLVAVYRLPVHSTAGATLFSTLVSSVAGVLIYWGLAQTNLSNGLAVTPDWQLGGLFGLGGAIGMYLGARLQRYLPTRLIKIVLTVLLLLVAGRYLAGLF
ncbi:MAG: sulfite exporter TauE/SafE family protein [bacterium]